jgi:hypothetical protein
LQHIALTCHQLVEHRVYKADKQARNQAGDDYDGEPPLGVEPMPVESAFPHTGF